jgi:hypothetical protein
VIVKHIGGAAAATAPGGETGSTIGRGLASQ